MISLSALQMDEGVNVSVWIKPIDVLPSVAFTSQWVGGEDTELAETK